jgi:hypothetical protein
MSKREKPGCQTIDQFFTKSVPSTHLPDVPCKQRTVDEDASSIHVYGAAVGEI